MPRVNKDGSSRCQRDKMTDCVLLFSLTVFTSCMAASKEIRWIIHQILKRTYSKPAMSAKAIRDQYCQWSDLFTLDHEHHNHVLRDVTILSTCSQPHVCRLAAPICHHCELAMKKRDMDLTLLSEFAQTWHSLSIQRSLWSHPSAVHISTHSLAMLQWHLMTVTRRGPAGGIARIRFMVIWPDAAARALMSVGEEWPALLIHHTSAPGTC